jgi:hypothetical protein
MSGPVSRRRRKERKKEQFSEITERIQFSAILQAHKRANNSTQKGSKYKCPQTFTRNAQFQRFYVKKTNASSKFIYVLVP